MLDIRDTLVIDGSGQSITISGNNAVPVMTTLFAPALTLLTLNAITIANGFDNIAAGGGAGVYIAGQVSLNVSNSVFAGNTSSNTAGAIYFNGGLHTTLTVANSRFTGNSGIGSSAISSAATTIITNSTFENNVGVSGALLTNGGGTTLTVSGSTFTGNSATNGAGGAIRTAVLTTITTAPSTPIQRRPWAVRFLPMAARG